MVLMITFRLSKRFILFIFFLPCHLRYPFLEYCRHLCFLHDFSDRCSVISATSFPSDDPSSSAIAWHCSRFLDGGSRHRRSSTQIAVAFSSYYLMVKPFWCYEKSRCWRCSKQIIYKSYWGVELEKVWNELKYYLHGEKKFW